MTKSKEGVGMKYKIQDRLKLKYMDQVEFIRFHGVYKQAETSLRHLELDIKATKELMKQALDEIERLMSNPELSKGDSSK